MIEDLPVECAHCAALTRDYDFDDRGFFICAECAKRAEDDDPSADLDDWRYHQRRGA